MSRHRNFRNMNYDDERDDEYDEEFHRYSISMDDDVPMSPSTAKFMYHRPRITSSNVQTGDTTKLSDFIAEEELENDVIYDEHENQFDLEVDKHVPGETKKLPLPAQSSSSMFSISRLPESSGPSVVSTKSSNQQPLDETSKKAIAKEEQPRLCVPEVENLRLSEVLEKGRGDSTQHQPTLTPNASYRRLSALAAAQATPTASPKFALKRYLIYAIVNSGNDCVSQRSPVGRAVGNGKGRGLGERGKEKLDH
ncbi:hypothetical protein Tcan_14958 [Toxocara canis]|uniref:Uncharacterized protein n=1 Tax=Toxocara canis TaxID=6265 RepID=A0A0B2V6L8_TOXCA|nr:hypothetical protein Tcan_14958 [Toxocara canis]